eukprot:COSAG06_NODE_49998_length_321_cov_1.265766_1_plen_44_part_01
MIQHAYPLGSPIRLPHHILVYLGLGRVTLLGFHATSTPRALVVI